MKIGILGATDPLGQELVSQALEVGHHVLALVRNPENMKIKHGNLQVHNLKRFAIVINL